MLKAQIRLRGIWISIVCRENNAAYFDQISLQCWVNSDKEAGEERLGCMMKANPEFCRRPLCLVQWKEGFLLAFKDVRRVHYSKLDTKSTNSIPGVTGTLDTFNWAHHLFYSSGFRRFQTVWGLGLSFGVALCASLLLSPELKGYKTWQRCALRLSTAPFH